MTPARLSQIEPQQFARSFARVVVGHMCRMEVHFYGPSWRPYSPALETTDIYRVVLELASYARGEQALLAPVRDYLIALAPLYGSVLGTGMSGEPEDESPDTALGVVIHAAIAREQLSHLDTITSVRFSALSGVPHGTLGQMIRNGELVASRDELEGGWQVSALEATRWLAAHAPS